MSDVGIPRDPVSGRANRRRTECHRFGDFQNPTAGAIMEGTGGCRKLRFAGKGKGKSGGYRTVHYYAGDDVPVLLLSLIDKGEEENLSKTERNELRIELAGYAADYRKGVIEKVAALKK
jgi:hypothetical protein